VIRQGQGSLEGIIAIEEVPVPEAPAPRYARGRR
jgi:hypothetical protein